MSIELSRAAAPTESALPQEERPSERLRREFAASKIAVVALIVLLSILFAAIFAPLLAPQDPYDLMQLSILDGLLPPGTESMNGFTYLLGTDDQGRDLYSGILYGLR